LGGKRAQNFTYFVQLGLDSLNMKNDCEYCIGDIWFWFTLFVPVHRTTWFSALSWCYMRDRVKGTNVITLGSILTSERVLEKWSVLG